MCSSVKKGTAQTWEMNYGVDRRGGKQLKITAVEP